MHYKCGGECEEEGRVRKQRRRGRRRRSIEGLGDVLVVGGWGSGGVKNNKYHCKMSELGILWLVLLLVGPFSHSLHWWHQWFYCEVLAFVALVVLAEGFFNVSWHKSDFEIALFTVLTFRVGFAIDWTTPEKIFGNFWCWWQSYQRLLAWYNPMTANTWASCLDWVFLLHELLLCC